METEKTYDSLDREQLKAELDAREIEYNGRKSDDHFRDLLEADDVATDLETDSGPVEDLEEDNGGDDHAEEETEEEEDDSEDSEEEVLEDGDEEETEETEEEEAEEEEEEDEDDLTELLSGHEHEGLTIITARRVEMRGRVYIRIDTTNGQRFMSPVSELSRELRAILESEE